MAMSWFYCMIFLYFARFVFSQDHVQCHKDQHSQLLQLRNELGDISFATKLASWTPDTDCCSWSGVTCNAGYVIALDLSSENLKGSLNDTSSLFNLTHLTSVNLASNIFQGTIPSAFGNLVFLKNLNLAMAGFGGQIPSSISKLKRLVSLDLSSLSWFDIKAENPSFATLVKHLPNLEELCLDYVNLTSHEKDWSEVLSSSCPNLRVLRLKNTGLTASLKPSFQNLANLSVIDLSENKFDSPFPTFLTTLKNLSYLNLYYCGLSGEIPSSVSQLVHLTFFDLSSNHISGHIPSFSQAMNLQVLRLDKNKLSGSILSTDWKLLKKMNNLRLRDNSFTGSIPASLYSLPLLTQLSLDNNNFSSFTNDQPISSSFAPLTRLDLQYNQLHGPLPASIFHIHGLDYIDLTNNNFGVTLDLKSFEKMKDLYHLDLSNSNLAVEVGQESLTFPKLNFLGLASCNVKMIPAFLKKSPEIVDVDLSHNQIYGSVPSWIWNVGRLTVLKLAHNYLQGVEALSSAPKIEILDLEYNFLHEKLPSFPHAISLSLSGNQFNSSILSVMSDPMPSLGFLRLSNNNLHGNIPASICNYTSLYVLDVSDNFLSGSIPECFPNAENIYNLNMSHNSLTGPIPQSLANLTRIISLDLARNQLSGKIPRELASLTSLTFLNVSYNQLEGKIPEGPQFKSFPVSSFEGNKGLCGFPLTTKCKY